MKLLVLSAIGFIVVLVIFIAQSITHNDRKAKAKENLADSPRTYDSVAITKDVLANVDGIPARQASEELTQFVESDDAPFLVYEDEHGSLDLYEECCPEEGLKEVIDSPVEDAESFWNRQERQLREKHGDIPEIQDFIVVARKLHAKEQPALDEYIAHLRALSILVPTEGNIEAYRQVTENSILPGTFKINFE